MRLAFTLAMLVTIPLVALWAAAFAVYSAVDQGAQMIVDAWS